MKLSPIIFFIFCLHVNLVQAFKGFIPKPMKIFSSLLGLGLGFGCGNPLEKTYATDLRQTIANLPIPGGGSPDIYYPSAYEGKWKVFQTFTSLEFQKEEDKKAKLPRIVSLITAIPTTIEYERIYSKYNDKIILDRSISESGRYKALNNLKIPNNRDNNNRDNGFSYSIGLLATWVPENPNILSISSSSSSASSVDEIKVTKRSIENLETKAAGAEAPTTIGYSEYARVAETDGTGIEFSIPKIFGQRILARYRISDEDKDKAIGLERLYIYDGETLDLGAKSSPPLIVLKSKVEMTRIK